MESANKRRMSYIDVAKGIGIILTVLGHCLAYGCQNIVFKAIYAFHMPLFFLLSGYVYRPKTADSFFSGKLKSLFLPVVFFESLNLFIFFVLKISSKMAGFDFCRYYAYLTFGGFWFPLTLLYITSVHYLIDTKFASRTKYPNLIKVASSLIFLIVGLVYAKKISDKPNQLIATAMVGYFFYEAGTLLAEYVPKMIKSISVARLSRIFNLAFGCVLLALLFYFVGFADRTVDMNTSRYGNRRLFVMNALMGSFAILFVSLGVQKSKVLEWYGKNSLMLLFVHIPLWKSFDFLLERLTPIRGGTRV